MRVCACKHTAFVIRIWGAVNNTLAPTPTMYWWELTLNQPDIIGSWALQTPTRDMSMTFTVDFTIYKQSLIQPSDRHGYMQSPPGRRIGQADLDSPVTCRQSGRGKHSYLLLSCVHPGRNIKAFHLISVFSTCNTIQLSKIPLLYPEEEDQIEIVWNVLRWDAHLPR